MNDITTRADLEILLSAFYKRLLEHKSMRHIFLDVAGIDLQEHLPHIVAFWEQSLFNTKTYRKNVMQLHLDLHQKIALGAADFSLWLATFNSVADDMFRGEMTEKLKTRALSIATIMQIKIHSKMP